MQDDIERIDREYVMMRVRLVTCRRARTVIFSTNKKIIEDLFAIRAARNTGIFR